MGVFSLSISQLSVVGYKRCKHLMHLRIRSLIRNQSANDRPSAPNDWIQGLSGAIRGCDTLSHLQHRAFSVALQNTLVQIIR